LSRSQYEQEALLLIRFHLAQGNAQEALTDLQHLLDEISDFGAYFIDHCEISEPAEEPQYPTNPFLSI
jgi:hypothetical protein